MEKIWEKIDSWRCIERSAWWLGTMDRIPCIDQWYFIFTYEPECITSNPQGYYEGKFHPPQRPPHEIFNHPDKLMIAIGTPGVFHSAANEDTAAGKLYRLSRLYVCARCVLMQDTKCNATFEKFLESSLSWVILLTLSFFFVFRVIAYVKHVPWSGTYNL